MYIDGALPEADRNRLILYVCDDAFRLREITVAGVGGWSWTDTGLDWSIHGGRTVHLYYDDAAPTLVSTARAGSRVTLTFSEDLDADSVPAMGAFAVEVGGAAAALAGTDPVAVSGRKVTLTLASTPASGSAVTVAYTKPTGTDAKPLRDVVHNEVGDFGAKTANHPPQTGLTQYTIQTSRYIDEDTFYVFKAEDFDFVDADSGRRTGERTNIAH